MIPSVVGGVARALDVLVACLLAVIVGVTVAQVVARYGLDASLVWSEELNRLLYIWLVMLAAVRASHMRIKLLLDRVPEGARRALIAFNVALSLAALGLMLYGGVAMARLTAYDMFTGLAVSMKWMFVAVLVGGCGWAVTIVVRGWREAREPRELSS